MGAAADFHIEGEKKIAKRQHIPRSMAAVCCDDGPCNNREDESDRNLCGAVAWQVGAESPMDDEEDEAVEDYERASGPQRDRCLLVPSSSLQSILSSILEERCKFGGQTTKSVSEGDKHLRLRLFTFRYFCQFSPVIWISVVRSACHRELYYHLTSIV